MRIPSIDPSQSSARRSDRRIRTFFGFAGVFFLAIAIGLGFATSKAAEGNHGARKIAFLLSAISFSVSGLMAVVIALRPPAAGAAKVGEPAPAPRLGFFRKTRNLGDQA